MDIFSERVSDKSIYKERITDDMISDNYLEFINSGKGLSHLYKLNLLENRYQEWLKKYRHLSHSRRNMLMSKKKMDNKFQAVALDDKQSHIRWIKCFSQNTMTFVRNAAVLIGAGYFILIYDLKEAKWKFYSVYDMNGMEGIGCLEGARDEQFFAFSEKCQGSRIAIVNYPELETVYLLKDKYGGKVMGIGFSDNETLLALKCSFYEHRIVIWSWRSSSVIFSYTLTKPYLHPDLFRTSLDGPMCALMAYDRLKQVLQFWNINFCGEDTVLVNRRSSTINLDGIEVHDMFFNLGCLYLIDANGNIYEYDYQSDKMNLIISWIHYYNPVNDLKERQYLDQKLIELSKGLPESAIDEDCEALYVAEEKGVIPPEPTHISILEYSYHEYPSDEYEKDDEEIDYEHTKTTKKCELKCHMVWYKSGIVASGPDGRIKYFEFDGDKSEWMKKWGLIPACEIQKFITNQRADVLLGWSCRYGLVRIKPGEIHNEPIQFFGSNVRSMCLLHPSDSFLITLSQFPELSIWKKKSGKLMKIVKLECKMDKVLCHTNAPLVVLKPGKEGSLYAFDFTNPRAPKSWPPLKLVREPFSWILFLQNSDILVACCKGEQKFILIKAAIDKGFEVFSSLTVQHKLICLTTILSDDGMTRGVALFHAVPKDEKKVPKGYVAGKLFDMLRFPSMIVEKTWSSSNFYRSIACGPGIGHVLAIPADKKWEIHHFSISLKMAGGWQYIGCVKVGHQVGTFEMFLYDQHFMTYGFDGIVTCYATSEMFDENSKPFCVLFPHHRFDMGIQESVIDYKGQYIITRGHDGLLVCSRIKTKYRCKHQFHVPKQAPHDQIDVANLKYVIEYGTYFWEDIFKEKQMKSEMVISEGRIKRIKKEFNKIKELWEEYYADNMAETVENRIDDIEFQLNKEKLENLIISTERDTSATLTFLSNALQKYTTWIERWRENCSKNMTLKLLKLKPLIARYWLENFSQSMKPPQFQTYHALLNTLSMLDAAVFPIPSPKMLPWHQLDDDEEFPEFKLQKFPEDPKSLEDADTAQVAAVEQASIDDREEEMDEEHVDEEGVEEEEVEHDEKIEEIDDEDISPSPEVFDEIKCYKKNLRKKLISEKKFKTEENDKIIFKELKKLRRFNDQELRGKKVVLQELEDETDKCFKKWKKMYIDKYHLKKKKKTLLEEEEEGESEELFQSGQISDESRNNDDEEEEEEDEQDEVVEEEGERVDEGIEEGKVDGVDVKGEDQELNLEETEESVVIKKEQFSKTKIPENENSKEPSFTWSELELGDEAIEYYDLIDAQKPVEGTAEQKGKQKKEIEVPEWRDLPGDEQYADDKPPEDPLDEPFSMYGAQSLRFAPIDYGRCNEFALNGIFMTDIQVSTLQKSLEFLESSFNGMFNHLVKRKAEDLGVIKAKHATLVKNIDDYVNVCQGQPMEPPPNYDWSKEEMPDWVWEEPCDDELPVKPYKAPVKIDYHVDEFIEEGFIIDNDPFRQQCLHDMMGGVLEVTWQEELQEELEMPKFLIEKEPDEYNEKNIAEVEKYLRLKMERETKLRYHKEVAENEIQKLFAEIKHVVRNYDMDVLNTARKKLMIDACMQSELLKMSRLKQKRMIADKTLENIRHMKMMIKTFYSEGIKMSAMSRLFLRKTALLYNEVDKCNAKLKAIEGELFSKLEPLKLSKKAVENLKLLIKKKPTMDFENNKVYPTELLCIARSLVNRKFPPYFSKATNSFFTSLSKLDSVENCPANIDGNTWDILVEHRHMKIVMDLKSKAYQMFAGEAEKTASLYYKYFVSHLHRFDKLKCGIRDQRIKLEHHFNSMDFQLVLPEGLVETHQTGNLEDFKDCVYVSKKYIDNLNKEIIELQKKKDVRCRDFDRYMKVVNDAELLHKELRLRIKIKENLLRDVKTAKITKLVKDFLSEYHRKRHPTYEVKLYDHQRQEKIKAMIRKYFKIYYKSLKEIKDADREKKIWAKNTIALRAKNDQLAAEAQELGDLVNKLDTQAIEKPLQERNEAIMLHGKLMRKVEANSKELEQLEAELTQLYNRTYITNIKQ